MSHVRIKQRLPKTQQEIETTLNELNREFKVDFDANPTKVLLKWADLKKQKPTLKHYPQIPAEVTEETRQFTKP